jgi:hypothetical protein
MQTSRIVKIPHTHTIKCIRSYILSLYMLLQLIILIIRNDLHNNNHEEFNLKENYIV